MARPVIIFLLILFASALAGAQPAPPPTKAPAPQKLNDRLEIRVTGLRTAQEWKMFGDMPGMPTAKPRAGEVLLIVVFAVRDLKTGKPDTDESFKDFALEDQSGVKHESAIAGTDLREIAFSMPASAKPKTFRIAGLIFDVSSLPMSDQR